MPYVQEDLARTIFVSRTAYASCPPASFSRRGDLFQMIVRTAIMGSGQYEPPVSD